MTMSDPVWTVLKFGGTSVSQASTWQTIIWRVQTLLSHEGAQLPEGTASKPRQNVWIVVSALSQVTNRLEQCVRDIDNFSEHLEWIVATHKRLAADLGDESLFDDNLQEQFARLEKLLSGIKLTGEIASSRLFARVCSFGEMFSSILGHNILRKLSSHPAECITWLDARDLLTAEESLGSSEEDRFLNAHVQPKTNLAKAEELLDLNSNPNTRSRVVITQGFIASTPGTKGGTSLLGRGGGDVSGGLFACLLGAQRLEIWTDVHGLFTSDPRHVPQARHIPELSYREAQELAAMGARVLHPKSLIPAAFAEIPVQIRNTMQPTPNKFTTITTQTKLRDTQTTVMAIARRLDQVLITLSTVDMWGSSGFMSLVFEPFDRYKVSVDLIATSQYAVSLTVEHVPGGVNGSTFRGLISALERIASVEVHEKCAVVSIVGRRLRTVLHLMADAFKELAQFNVKLLSESTEDLNLSFVVEQNSVDDINTLVCNLHRVLLEEKRGLPSPKITNADFGNVVTMSPATQKLSDPISMPSVASGSFRLSNSIVNASKVPDFSQLGIRNGSDKNPCQRAFVFTIASLKACSERLSYFPVRLSEDPMVLKIVNVFNPEISFVAETDKHMQILNSAFLKKEVIKVTFKSATTIPAQSFQVTNGLDEVTFQEDLLSLRRTRTIIVPIKTLDLQENRILVDLTIKTGNDSTFEISKALVELLKQKSSVESRTLNGAKVENMNFTLYAYDGSANGAFNAPLILCRDVSLPSTIFEGDLLSFADFPIVEVSPGSDSFRTVLI